MSNQLTLQDTAKMNFLEVCNMKRLGALVGEKNTASFLSDFMLLAEQNPKADFKNLARCCIEIASMKLPILKQAGQAYVVPRGSCYNVEIGYKGWLVLAKRVGIAVRVYPIYQGDSYSFEISDFEQKFNFIPLEGNLSADKTPEFIEKNLKFIAVVTKDLVTGLVSCELVEFSLLKRLRSKSTSKDSPAYKEWLLEMYKAKAIKYVLKKMPLDTLDSSIFKAMEFDDRNDVAFKEETKAMTSQVELGSAFSSAMIDNQKPQEQKSEEIVIPSINIDEM